MFKRLRRGFFVAVVLLFMLCLGFATPALADGEPTYTPDNAKLTAVIVAPVGTDASQDTYVFHFDGDGTVIKDPVNEESNKVFSDGVEQDGSVKVGDVVPKIGDKDGNVTLEGTALTNDNSLTDGQLGQTVVQKSITEILIESEILVKIDENGGDVLANCRVDSFPHAGIYTYEVTQTSATSDTDKAYVTPSQAKYCLRIWVKNANTGSSSLPNNMDLEIDYVTVQRLLNDDGAEEKNNEGIPVYEKVNPTNPTTNEQGKITGISGTNQLAGVGRGRNVLGFTFANEYITIAPLKVKKLYDGNHADRTRYSTVELAVHSSASPNTNGGALTYKIEGDGRDLTEGSTVNGADESMVPFNNNGWCYIKADLKEGSSIRITGELGPLVNGSRETLSTNGLFRGQTYYVLENDPGDYRPTGYVHEGSDSYTNEENEVVYIDPRVSHDGMSETGWVDVDRTITDTRLQGTSIYNKEHGLNAFALLLINEATGNDTTIFVVNSLDDNKVSPTGIFVDNLPYILMIGMPLVVFAGMFVARRRGYAA